MNSHKPVILLVEDDENDVFFMRRALNKAEIDFSIQIVVNGQDALDYLGGARKFGDRALYPLPSLVFLDLKLPFVGGLDVLEWIRSQPSLKELPIVVLTSSAEGRDRQKAAELGVKAYFVKPPTPEMVREAMQFAKELVSAQ